MAAFPGSGNACMGYFDTGFCDCPGSTVRTGRAGTATARGEPGASAEAPRGNRPGFSRDPWSRSERSI